MLEKAGQMHADVFWLFFASGRIRGPRIVGLLVRFLFYQSRPGLTGGRAEPTRAVAADWPGIKLFPGRYGPLQ